LLPTERAVHHGLAVARCAPVAASCRELFGNPNPVAASGSWPAQHPVAMAIGSSLVIIAICAPLASSLLRRRTTD
jgi:hypothetical protein